MAASGDRKGTTAWSLAGRLAAALIALALPAAVRAAAPAGAPSLSSDQPISLEAASSDFDYRNNRLLFRKVRIAQGAMSVEADEATATGLEFENSQWTFTGNVRIRLPDGLLDSQSATVTFRRNEIAQARITGVPATFEQRRESDQLARGRAGAMEYDVAKGTMQLSGNAWLSDGQNEITGDTLVYDIGRERVLANPGGQDPGGVSIIINPRSLPNPADRQPQQPGPGT